MIVFFLIHHPLSHPHIPKLFQSPHPRHHCSSRISLYPNAPSSLLLLYSVISHVTYGASYYITQQQLHSGQIQDNANQGPHFFSTAELKNLAVSQQTLCILCSCRTMTCWYWPLPFIKLTMKLSLYSQTTAVQSMLISHQHNIEFANICKHCINVALPNFIVAIFHIC